MALIAATQDQPPNYSEHTAENTSREKVTSTLEHRGGAPAAGHRHDDDERTAAGSELAIAAILDTLLVLSAIAAAAGLATLTHRNALGSWLLIGGTALAAAGAWLCTRWLLGTSPAHALLGLRTIDGLTGMPGAPLRRGRRTLRIRRGADPLRLRPRPMHLAGVREGAPPWFATKGVLLVFDDGSRYALRHATVIGRDPHLEPASYVQLAIPDFSRTMALSHILLRVDAEAIIVTDLGDEAGTWIITQGREQRLAPGTTQRIPFGSQLRLGARYLALSRHSTAEERRA